MTIDQEPSEFGPDFVLSQEDLEAVRLEFEEEVLDVFNLHGLKDQSFKLGPIQRTISEGGTARSLRISWKDNNGVYHDGVIFRNHDVGRGIYNNGLEVDIFSESPRKNTTRAMDEFNMGLGIAIARVRGENKESLQIAQIRPDEDPVA